jgi:hypothetical protein
LRRGSHLFRLLLLCWLAPAHAATLTLELGAIETPVVTAKGVALVLTLSALQPLELSIDELRLGSDERVLRRLRVRCLQSRVGPAVIECRGGRISFAADIDLNFTYWLRKDRLELDLEGPEGERWRLTREGRGRNAMLSLQVENGDLVRFAPAVPPSLPRLAAGRVSGRARLFTGRDGRPQLDAALRLSGVRFSDAAGLAAAEGVGLAVELEASGGPVWEGRAAIEWGAGEVFWAPFYFAPATRRLTLAGRVAPGEIVVEDGRLEWQDLGTVDFRGRWDTKHARFTRLEARTGELALGALYGQLVKPLVAGSFLGALSLDGMGRGSLRVEEGRLAQLTVSIEQAQVLGRDHSFEVQGLAADIPWRAEGGTRARIAVAGGRMRGITLGTFDAAIDLESDGLRLARLSIPLLDGRLNITDVHVFRQTTGWQGEAAAVLEPVSMEALATGLGWPRMHGSLSGIVPRVIWREGVLALDGALLFRVFDGTAVVKKLRVEGLAGAAPFTQAELDMRNLDLELITRTFSFGRMEGRIDLTVADLALSGARPVRFAASVASSPGDYPRRISQRAVDNIAALGGGSAAAALQRSFLRFFEDFRYRRIGLAGRLERGVLVLTGLADQGEGFLIVEGGGIPALSVIGYNHGVDWNELLTRLSRIREGHAPPVIK